MAGIRERLQWFARKISIRFTTFSEIQKLVLNNIGNYMAYTIISDVSMKYEVRSVKG
jgi:hypothetical protein